MESDRFDQIVRPLAFAPSRREVVRLLAAGPLIALGLEQAVAGAAKRTPKKKKKKDDANKFCKKQVGECETALAVSCGLQPECLPAIDCCSFLGACNASGFLTCLQGVSGP